MSRTTRDGTVKPISRDQILRRERKQGNLQDWQPYPVDPYSAISVRASYIARVRINRVKLPILLCK